MVQAAAQSLNASAFTALSIQVGMSSLVAVASAFLGARLALRTFSREKWWEAKMAAYMRILEALHHMNRDLTISSNAERTGRDTDDEFHQEWSKKHEAAWDEIRRQVDMGEFLFSPAAMRILEELLDDGRGDDPNEMYIEHLGRLQESVRKCMPAIKAAARKDLGLPALRMGK